MIISAKVLPTSKWILLKWGREEENEYVLTFKISIEIVLRPTMFYRDALCLRCHHHLHTFFLPFGSNMYIFCLCTIQLTFPSSFFSSLNWCPKRSSDQMLLDLSLYSWMNMVANSGYWDVILKKGIFCFKVWLLLLSKVSGGFTLDFRLQFLTFIFRRIVDVQRGELVSIKERWYSYDVEQKAIVMKHISSLRCKKNINLSCYPHVFYSFDSIEEFGKVILENSYLLQLIVKN